MTDMIKIAYCNVENLDLNKAYPLVSAKRKEKIDFYRFNKDKRLSCGAYLLAEKMLAEEGIVNPNFETHKFGKTYISNYENIYFNISHSKNMVSCAISDAEIGCDIEFNDPQIDLNISKNYFFNSEYENIKRSKNPSNEFFKYWVLKESYMKYCGLGFRLELSDFEIVIDSEIRLKNDIHNIKFNLFDVGRYKLATAGHFKTKEVNEYSLEDLY